MPGVWGDLRQWFEDETALMQCGVWDRELRGINDGRAEEQDIDIDDSRTFCDYAFASHLLLDVQDRREQLFRKLLGFQRDDAVQEPRLPDKIHRLGFVKRRYRGDVAQSTQCIDGRGEIRGTISDVRSERQIHRFTHTLVSPCGPRRARLVHGRSSFSIAIMSQLRCLLLTRDDQTIRVLRKITDDLELALEVCTGADKAAEELEQCKFDAVLIDCDDVHNAITVMRSVRMTPSNKTSTVFAIVNGITTPTSAIELGANLSLEKPINEGKARHALKTVHGLMLQERRRYYRHEVDMAVTLRFEDKEKKSHHEIVGTAVNISEGGMALKMKTSIPWEYRTAVAKFLMPGSQDYVEVDSTIAWADEQGHAGIRFDKIPLPLREHLAKFFRESEAKDKQTAPVKKPDR